MRIIEFIFLCTGVIVWFFIIAYLLSVFYAKLCSYYRKTLGSCIGNLRIAYQWYKMPIKDLNSIWELHIHYDYRFIRKYKRYNWVSRYILVKRIRKYRNQIAQNEQENNTRRLLR